MTSKFEKIKYLLYNMKWDLLCWGIIMDLKENERIDDLEYKGLKIIQNENYFCFGIDSILLSDFAKDLKICSFCGKFLIKRGSRIVKS